MLDICLVCTHLGGAHSSPSENGFPSSWGSRNLSWGAGGQQWVIEDEAEGMNRFVLNLHTQGSEFLVRLLGPRAEFNLPN